MIQPMKPEQTRREQFTSYSAMLRERFQSGLLSELQTLPQWVVWRAEIDGQGKQKKVPYNPNHHLSHASVKIPKSWGTLEQALKALATGNYSGIGFLIPPPLVFIDLDHSYNRASGTITDPQAAEIVQSLNSYTEASPGNGLHILAYGKLPGRGIHTAIEMYGQDRFTTITTDHVEGTPRTIEHRQEAIDALYRRFAPSVVEATYQNTGGGVGSARLTELPPEAANDRLLQELLRGDMASVGNDHHRADWNALMKLLHWTGDDIPLSREIFLNSPLGQRAKAQEIDGEGRRGNTNYVDRTIKRIREKRRNPPMKR